MEENLLSAFDYAIDTANSAVFDALAKDFASFSHDDKETLLIRTCVRAPSLGFVQHVLGYGYSLDYKGDDGATLLHYAAGSEHAEIIRHFIKEGLDVNAKDNDGLTPLCYAAQYAGSADVLKALLDAGADASVTDAGGETLLITAAGRNPTPEVTKFLLEQGFDTEERDNDGFTAVLNAALWQSNEDVIALLVDAGADISAKTNDGSTMLHLAARNESLSVVRYISSAFSTWDVDNDGFSTLRAALVGAQSADVIKLFLRKAQVEHLEAACFNKNPDILEALLQSGYDVNAADSDGVTALMTAAQYNTNPAVIRMLRYYNAVWNNADDKGRNALHHAAANSDSAIYEWMLTDDDFKTLAAHEDADGNTPAYYREHQEEF